MRSSDKTKLILAEELKRQSRTTQFCRITVGGLCAACNLDRRTFYNHFRDIYDLAAWIFERSIADCLPKEGETSGIHEVEEALSRLKKDAVFYRRALAEDSQNALGRHMLAHNADFYTSALMRLLKTDRLSEDVQFAIYYHCFGSLGMIRKWLFHDCTPEPAVLARQLLASMPSALRQLFDPES